MKSIPTVDFFLCINIHPPSHANIPNPTVHLCWIRPPLPTCVEFSRTFAMAPHVTLSVLKIKTNPRTKPILGTNTSQRAKQQLLRPLHTPPPPPPAVYGVRFCFHLLGILLSACNPWNLGWEERKLVTYRWVRCIAISLFPLVPIFLIFFSYEITMEVDVSCKELSILSMLQINMKRWHFLSLVEGMHFCAHKVFVYLPKLLWRDRDERKAKD